MTRTHQTLALLSLVGCGVSCAPNAWALDSSLRVTQFAHRTWTVPEGFTKVPIAAITQAPDGYLVLGTQFGLVRFDGVRALSWAPPEGPHVPSSSIASLLYGRDGTLWIGTMRGLVGWKSGKATEYPPLAGLLVNALAQDDNGTVWAGGFSYTSNGKLCAILTNEVRCSGVDGRLGHGVLGLYVDRANTLWAGVLDGFWRWTPGTPQFYPVTGEPNGVQLFSEDGKQALLIALRGRVARLTADGLTTANPYPSTLQDVHASRILQDRDGALWIGTVGHGLIRTRAGDSEVFTSAGGLTDDVVTGLFEDREGNFWVATPKGLDRFSPYSVVTFSEREGLASGASASAVAARDGSIWFAAADRIYLLRDGHVTVYRSPDTGSGAISRGVTRRSMEVIIHGLPSHAYTSMFEDARGRIWIAATGGVGYLQDDRFISIAGVPRGLVYALTGDRTGHLWISNFEQGLVHLFEDRLQEVIPWSAFEDHGLATALAIDPSDATLWIGFSRGGIGVLSGGQVRASFAVSDGLAPGRVSNLRFDPDGTLWAATDGGLSRLKGRHFDTITTENGLPCNRLIWSARSNDRSLWLYGECGLIRLDAAALEGWSAGKASRIQATLLDQYDGVNVTGDLSESLASPPAVSPDGKIWFATPAGLSVVDPRRFAINRVPPPVHIERMMVNGVPYDISRSMRLPPRIRDVGIEYTALSFVAPEKVRFRYRLDGQDRDWREGVNNRQVQYSNLAPGGYRFRVIASNNSGVWNEQGDTLDFSIAPAYWQTNWFRALCVLVFVGLLLLAYQLRLRQLSRAFNMTLEARVSERTRIARELHDTLLQSLQGLLLRFRTVQTLIPTRPGEAQELLESAIGETRTAVTESRSAVQGLRSSAFETSDFTEAIRSLGEALASDPAYSSSVALILNVEGTPRALQPLVRDEIYRTAGEALRNAYRHAHASRIEVQLHYGERRFELRVRDDGKGIDSSLMSDEPLPGHFGLRGMRERAKELGAKFALWSAPGSGTELELSIPSSVVYATSLRAPHSWFAGRFFASRTARSS